MSKYSVLLPTYNERDNIGIIVWLLVRTFKEHDIDYEIVIVDDNSPDGTQDVIRKLQEVVRDLLLAITQMLEARAHFTTGVVIASECATNAFLGSAYVHGMSHASGDFIVIMDADLSHHEHRVESPAAGEIMTVVAG
eukprot:gene29984-37432_t